MQILRVADIPNSRTGGMSRAMYGTGDVLVAQGHTVDYLYAEDLPTSGTARWRRLILPYLLPRFVKAKLRNGRSYDVIEIHEPLAAPYCFLRRHDKILPPVVVYSHGLEERSIRAEKAYCRQKRLPYSLKEQYSPVTFNRLWHSRYAVRHSDHFVGCNSEDIAYLKNAGVPARRLTQLNNGVQSEFIASGNALDAQRDRSGVLFLGSWIIRKGIIDVVVAMSEMMRRHPTLHFTVAGCSCSEDNVLTQFGSELRPRIKVIPQIKTNVQLIELYQTHAIFLLPSYFEGLPLALLEAAAIGMAIVTTNICGMADFVDDGVNGFTVSVGDVVAIVQRLQQLVCDPLAARRMGEMARQKVQAYTWENGAQQMAEAYKATLYSRSL